jgi:hypothetical protein
MQPIIFKNVEIVLREINYEVNYDETTKIALITPVIDAISQCEIMLIISLDVDGHELIEPHRVKFKPGLNKVKLRKIKIVNPLNRQLHAREHRDHAYRMAFKIATLTKERKLHASNLVI